MKERERERGGGGGLNSDQSRNYNISPITPPRFALSVRHRVRAHTVMHHLSIPGPIGQVGNILIEGRIMQVFKGTESLAIHIY